MSGGPGLKDVRERAWDAIQRLHAAGLPWSGGKP